MWYLETALALLEGDELDGEDLPQHDLHRTGLDPGTRLVITEPDSLTTDLIEVVSSTAA
jgi:hypothetical protein